ncbi:MAG: hypothetical protein AYK19_05660 [Theionarchaea archaeon DG-70-1]|nr:MAG: hypothetical protein AYK19_05660 [Theionarchaea archaeon DG-70-1]
MRNRGYPLRNPEINYSGGDRSYITGFFQIILLPLSYIDVSRGKVRVHELSYRVISLLFSLCKISRV